MVYTVETQGRQNAAALVMLGMYSDVSRCKSELPLGPDWSSLSALWSCHRSINSLFFPFPSFILRGFLKLSS